MASAPTFDTSCTVSEKARFGIALQLTRLEHDVPDGMAVRADEPAALIVERQAVLALPAHELELDRAGIEARVARRELDRRPLGVSGRR